MKVLTLDVSPIDADVMSDSQYPRSNLSSPTNKNTQSQKKAKEGDNGDSEKLPKWERKCKDISYVQNNFTNEQCPGGLFKVQFSYEFKKGAQEIYFAHSLPYTYSMLCEYLNKQKIKRHTLCYSLAGNKIEYIHITNKPKTDEQKEAEEKARQKKKHKE